MSIHQTFIAACRQRTLSAEAAEWLDFYENNLAALTDGTEAQLAAYMDQSSELWTRIPAREKAHIHKLRLSVSERYYRIVKGL